MKTSTLIIATAIAGVAGYFAWQHFSAKKTAAPKAPSATAPVKPTSVASSSSGSGATLAGLAQELVTRWGIKTAPTVAGDGDTTTARVSTELRY